MGLFNTQLMGGQIEGFVDDSLLFCQARAKDVEAIQALLNLNEKASGQEINSAKTTLFFSKNVSDPTKEKSMRSIWVCQQWWEEIKRLA